MSDKTQEIEEAIVRGEKRLVEKQPELFASASQITDDIAAALGTPKSELQAVELRKAIADFAKLKGEDVTEMLITIGTDSQADADRLIGKQRASISRALGM